MSNLLLAIANIIKNPVTNLVTHYSGSNRANNMWDALETYVKDIFCDLVDESDEVAKYRKYSEIFSYLWNKNNPPDIILRGWDAIEVKKIETMGSALALNSSYPKHKLYFDDTRIMNACRNCEIQPWSIKDIIYTIGVTPKGTNQIKALWFIYGDCYAADREVYQKIADRISDGIAEIWDIDLTDTNELAGVKWVDPLGITNLRVRWMWQIENPIKVFREVTNLNKDHKLTINAILLEDKYLSFPKENRESLESMQNAFFKISDIEIKSPNNPARLLRAKFIHYAK